MVPVPNRLVLAVLIRCPVPGFVPQDHFLVVWGRVQPPQAQYILSDKCKKDR